MKYITILFFLTFLTNVSYGQNGIKLRTVKMVEGRKARHISYYDRMGNCTFSKVDGIYGPIVVISAWDFDSLGRETRSISAHCNAGFTLRNKEYEKNIIKTFIYNPLKNDTSGQSRKYLNHPFDFIEKINSKEQLYEIVEVKNLLLGTKVLESITFLDENNSYLQRINLTKHGDTSTIESYIDSNWKVAKYFNKNEEENKTAIIKEFDHNGNLIKELRVQANGISEDYYFKYSASNKNIETLRYVDKIFEDKTAFLYDAKDRKIRKIEYYHKPDKITFITYFKYDSFGNEVKETCVDLTGQKKKLKYVYKFENTYWK